MDLNFCCCSLTAELKQHYDEQVKEMMGKYHRELSQIQEEHKVELNRMQKALDVVSVSVNTSRLLQWSWKKEEAGGKGREHEGLAGRFK